jgi:hypothetical protein
MKPTHNKNFMILASSVDEIKSKVDFHKAPPMGLRIRRKSSKVPKGIMALYDHHTTKR